MAAQSPANVDDSTRQKLIMLALRRALLMIVVAIEQVYGLDPKERIVIVVEQQQQIA